MVDKGKKKHNFCGYRTFLSEKVWGSRSERRNESIKNVKTKAQKSIYVTDKVSDFVEENCYALNCKKTMIVPKEN